MRPGQTIAGKYRLLRVVRSGGVSVVYRAEELGSRRPVAVKLINVAQAALDLRRRIEREVAILGRLHHRHIVRCYDHGVLEGDRMFLALEWLDGQDLADYSALHPLTLRQILELLVQVADALEVAHAAGIVHRDIKPANVYLMKPQPGLRPDARLLDFGVAKIPESEASLTRAGAILGTPSYMAPEQASEATEADGRADVFGLGVVAYELVAGKLPWTSTTDLARLARILIEEAVPLSEVVPNVPDAVASLVMGMLERDRERRIPSAAAVRDIAATCLDVSSPRELDSTYVQDEARLGVFVRAETLDLPPSGASRGVGGRRHSTPTGVIEEHGLADPAPRSVRYRSVVAGSVEAPAEPVEEEHDDTQELSVPKRSPSVLDDESPEEPTEFRAAPVAPPVDAARAEQPTGPDRDAGGSWPSLSATAALDAVSDTDMPAVPLSELDAGGFGSLLSYVDHTPSAMLYGRVAGLERLERRATQPLDVSQPTLTLVIGPAGIGKTRVRTELAKLVRARRHPPRVFAGRAEESFRTTPFGFLRRVLFTEARVRPGDDMATRRGKVLRMVPSAAAVRRLLSEIEPPEVEDGLRGPETSAPTAFMSAALMEEIGAEEAEAEEDRAVIAAFLCEALGVEYPDIPPVIAAHADPRLLGQQLSRALVVVLRALADEAGLVVLVDDAHLLDAKSAQLLSELTDPQRRVPVAVVAFALPTILDADTRERSPLVADPARPRETVQLGPLEPRASREMARSLVDGVVASDALELLVRQASGNPLYLEQLVRSVQANGALAVGPDGEYALVGLDGGDGDFDRVPPTVAAAVSARLSFLPPRLQRVLTAAAVFGEVFWAEGVAEMVSEPIEAVTEDLDRLLVANLVRRRAVSRYEDATELEFTHAVVRSVALSRLKRRRRVEFEATAGAYLERVGEEDPAVVARHVAQGGEVEPAARRYAEAAERALALGDAASAQILAEEGLRAAERKSASVGARVRLYGLVEQVALAHGDWELGRDALDQLSDLLTEPEPAARLLLRRSRLASMARRYEEARVEAQEAERAFSELGRSVDVASSQLYFAEASEALGDGRGALRGYLAAHVGLGKEGASESLARASRGLARIAASSGDYRNAENRFRSALVASRAVRDYPGIFLAEGGLAEVWRAMGDLSAARGFIEDASRVAYDPTQRLMLRVLQVRLLLEEERYDDAHARFCRLWDAAGEAPFGAVRRRAALGLGQSFRRRPAQDAGVSARRAELDEGSARLRAALDESLTEDPALITALQLAASVVDALRGEADRALGLAEDAQARFQAEGALAGDEPPAVFYTVARVHQIVGADRATVQAWLKKAVHQVDQICGRLERKGRTRYLERALPRAVLEEAERAGVEVARDVRSNRVSATRRP